MYWKNMKKVWGTILGVSLLIAFPFALWDALKEESSRKQVNSFYNDGVDAYKRKDYKEAVKWYTKAAEQGDAEAQSNLGVMYQNGQGVPQDYKEAVKWYTKATEQGFAQAQSNLTDAQFSLGAMYQNGQGVPQNYKEAIKWYRISAEQGNAETQYILGTMYRDGLGVLQDYALAHMWFNLCGSSGDKDCVKNRNIVEEEMSPAQIEEAQEMARNWKPKK
jgi:uncharacterized protein